MRRILDPKCSFEAVNIQPYFFEPEFGSVVSLFDVFFVDEDVDVVHVGQDLDFGVMGLEVVLKEVKGFVEANCEGECGKWASHRHSVLWRDVGGGAVVLEAV